MTRHINHVLALGAALLMCTANAQENQPVDIGLFQNGSELEVRLRPTASFDGIVSAVVFTLRYENGSGGSISDLQQKSAAQTYVPTRASGPLHDAGVQSYQVYAGFGMEPLSASGMSWEAGKEYVIANIPVASGAEYTLADDSWTGRAENNGDFYLSLNGVDHTGSIYKAVVGGGNGAPFSITPNPSRGVFVMSIPTVEGEDVSYEVVSSGGQVVAKKQLNVEGTSYREEMDLTNSGAGTYHLRLFRGTATETHKIVVN